MKLIQYRFSPSGRGFASLISEKVSSFFASVNDVDLVAVYGGDMDDGYGMRKSVSPFKLASTVESSFLQSYANKIENSYYASIRSKISCRFVVVEDDGLLRICYSNDDNIITFDAEICSMEDVSDLLIATDMFDFI